MTALGAMLAIAWAASSGPLITPRRSPASIGTLAAGPGGLWGVVVVTGSPSYRGGRSSAGRGGKRSGDEERAQGLAGLELFERLGGFGERSARGDERIEDQLTVHVPVDECGDVDGRAHRAVVRAQDALVGLGQHQRLERGA